MKETFTLKKKIILGSKIHINQKYIFETLPVSTLPCSSAEIGYHHFFNITKLDKQNKIYHMERNTQNNIDLIKIKESREKSFCHFLSYFIHKKYF